LGRDDEETLQASERLVAVENLLGKLPEAGALIRSVVESRTRTTGAESEETLLAQGNLAAILYSEGHYSEAAKTGSQTLEVMKRVTRPEHPVRLSSANNLALAYLALGRYGEAESMLQKIIEIRIRAQGADHPETLIQRNSLVLAYLMSGNFVDAERESLHVVEATRRLLGPQHPDTLAALRNLGAYTRSKVPCPRRLEGHQRVLGPQHPRTIVTMGWFGSAHAAAGKYRESEEPVQKAIDLPGAKLGPRPPDTLLIANDWPRLPHGREIRTGRKPVDCIDAGLRQNLGPEHPNSLLAAGSLAYIGLVLRNPKGAEDPLRPALAIYDERQPDHWGRFRCQAMLGASVAAQGKSVEAEQLLLAGYHSLVNRRDTIPADSRFIVDKAAEWQGNLKNRR
jgi:tetratricopeptide (TPR) repeat protein